MDNGSKFELSRVEPLKLRLSDHAGDRRGRGDDNASLKIEMLNSSLEHLRLEALMTQQEITPESTPKHRRAGSSSSSVTTSSAGSAENSEDNGGSDADDDSHAGYDEEEEEFDASPLHSPVNAAAASPFKRNDSMSPPSALLTKLPQAPLGGGGGAASLSRKSSGVGLQSLSRATSGLDMLGHPLLERDVLPPRAAGKITPIRRSKSSSSFKSDDGEVSDHSNSSRHGRRRVDAISTASEDEGDTDTAGADDLSDIDGALLHSPNASLGGPGGPSLESHVMNLNDSISRSATGRTVIARGLATGAGTDEILARVSTGAVTRSVSTLSALGSSPARSTVAPGQGHGLPTSASAGSPSRLSPALRTSESVTALMESSPSMNKREAKAETKRRVRESMEQLRLSLDTPKGQRVVELENLVRHSKGIERGQPGGPMTIKLKRPNATDPLGLTFSVPGALPLSSVQVDRVGWNELGRYVVVTNIDTRPTNNVVHSLQKGDVVLAVDGVEVHGIEGVQACLNGKKRAKIDVVRAGVRHPAEKADLMEATRKEIEREVKASTKAEIKAQLKAARKARKQ